MQSFLRSPIEFSHTRFFVTVRAAIAGAVIATVPVSTLQAAETATQTAVRSYSIAAGPLADRLAEFAAAAGVQLYFDAQALAGLQTSGLQGNHSVAGGFQKLLGGSGYEAVLNATGEFALRRQAAGAAVLPTMKINADTEQETATGPVHGYVAKRSATGTKTDTPLIETPQSISVVGRSEMVARGAQDLEEVIRYTPGIAVSTWGVDNRGYEFFTVRGFDANATNFRDGLRQSSFVNIVGLTEVYGLERIEILRGPSSTLYGKGDASGVVNRISKTPDDAPVREVELQYGSFNRWQAAFDAGGGLSDDGSVDARIVGLGRDSDSNNVSYPNGDELENERRYLAPSLRWTPTDDTSLILLAEFLANEAADDISYLTDANGELTDVLEGDPGYSAIEQTQKSIGYQFEHQFNETWSVGQNLRYGRTDADKHHIWSELEPDGRTLSRTAVRHKDRLDEMAIDTRLQANLTTGSTSHTVLFGTDWSKAEGDEQYWSGDAPSLDLYSPDYDIAIPEPSSLQDDYTQTTPQLGFYVQDQIRLDQRWVVTVGGRHDVVKMVTKNHVQDSRNSQKDSVFSGRAGVTYLFANGWAPYLSYAQSFLPNLGVDADNNAFDPSRGKQTELGVKFQSQNTRTFFAAALFELSKTNVVTYDDITSEARQIGEQRSRGAELELKTELSGKLAATASYTYLDMEVVESANELEIGKTPIQVPQDLASLWLDYELGHGFSAGVGTRYVGKRWNDEANTSEQSSFNLIDAALRYETGSWSFALNASNLFDREYVMSRAYGGYYLGQERSLLLTASYQW